MPGRGIQLQGAITAAGAHAGIEYDAGNAREQLRAHGPVAVILERQLDKIVERREAVVSLPLGGRGHCRLRLSRRIGFGGTHG